MPAYRYDGLMDESDDTILQLKRELQVVIATGKTDDILQAYADLGQSFFDQRQFPQALHCFEKMVSSQQESGQDSSAMETGHFKEVAYCQIGLIHLAMGDFHKALEFCQLHLRVSKELGSLHGQGMACSHVGMALESLGEYQQALEYHQKALAISEETGDVAEQGMAYVSIGSLYDTMGQYENSLQCHHNALAIADATGDLDAQATACSYIREAYRRLGNLQKALEYQQIELSLAESQGIVDVQIRGHNNLAELYARLQHSDRALHHYQKALSSARNGGYPEDETRALSGIGAIYQKQGKLTRAVECYQQAIRVAQQCDDHIGQSAHYNDLGTVYLLLGNFQYAAQSHILAWQLCTEDDIEDRAISLAGMGSAYYKLGDFQKCIKAYRRILDQAESVGDELPSCYMITACIGLGNSCCQVTQFDEAAEHFDRALELAEINGDSLIQAEAALLLGHVSFSLQRFDKAYEHYQKSFGVSQEISDLLGQCRACCGTANCYYAWADYQNAARLYKKALERGFQAEVESTDKGPDMRPRRRPKVQEGGKSEALHENLKGTEQLAVLLHEIVQQHRQQCGPSPSELMGAIYVYLWGLMAVLLNSGEAAPPPALPPGLVDTLVQSLMDASVVDRDREGVSSRYPPYIQHYCMFILYRLSCLDGLRKLVKSAKTIDAMLACLAFPKDPHASFGQEGAGSVPGGALQSHLVATKALKNFLAHSSPGEEGTRDLILHSPQLPALLDALPRKTKATDSSQLKQVVYILSMLTAISDPQMVLRQHNPASPLSPSPLGSPYSRAPSLRRLQQSPNGLRVVTAVSEVVTHVVATDECTDWDLKVLKLCLKLLLDFSKHGLGARAAASRVVDLHRIETYTSLHLPSSSGVASSAMDLCKMLQLPGPGEDAESVRVESVRSSSVLSDEYHSIADTSVDTTTHDSQDTTTFESLSSHSSDCAAVAVAHLTLAFEDDDLYFSDK